MISQTAAGVAGTMDLWSRHSLPMFTMWKPSTSFSGAMALHTARSLMCSGEEILGKRTAEFIAKRTDRLACSTSRETPVFTGKRQLHQQAADPPVAGCTRHLCLTQDAGGPGLVLDVGATGRVVPHQDHSQVGSHVALSYQLFHVTLDFSVELPSQLRPRNHHGGVPGGVHCRDMKEVTGCRHKMNRALTIQISQVTEM
ncbi:hypothetical protein EYF80_023259 [Liparis tanakae]|uniref:Uncharacterized protein n=1 Tax=Liparis tanakae TaxID=230148 RepID=A0A4Z2HNL2_9TELE|nr:hypothetical protein EYF80_023259 [Liparis tanakae]